MIVDRIGKQLDLIVAPADRRSATLHLVQSSRMARRLANLLIVGLFVSILAMAFLPWQQTSRGSGQVTAYVPQERQQTIQATIEGVIANVNPNVFEGSEVKKGDVILTIEPIAAGLQFQLEQQLLNLETKKETARVKAEAKASNVIAYTKARDATVREAQLMIEATKDKLEAKQKVQKKYEAAVNQTKLNFERQKGLMQKGARAVKDVEKFERDYRSAQAELEEVFEEIESFKNELAAKKSGLDGKREKAQAEIESAIAEQNDALGIIADTDKKISDIQIKIDSLSRPVIAPRDGTIFRMPVYELGRVVKKGESLFTLVPEISRKAVELWVNGNDMPLVQVGQEVRLQFEGWPAVQFAGWPSVAIGTFSGRVANVDPTDNGKGQFRVLVTEPVDGAWPIKRFLRQGVRANGWVMLNRVRLGYEVWRQLNGFPVIISDKEPGKNEKIKTPKLPK